MPARERRDASPDDPPAEVASALTEARRRIVGIEEWDLEQWFAAITRMHCLSAEQRLGLHDPDDPNILTLPYGPGLEGGAGQIGRENVRVIERGPLMQKHDKYDGPYIFYPSKPNDCVALHGVGYLIPRHDLPAMIVSLEGSYAHILAEIKKCLIERSKKNTSKALPRKPGRRSLSSLLRSGRAAKKWQYYHIVELVEMLAWNAVGGRQYPKHRIGWWISPSKLGTSKDTSKAILVARQAIASLPAIMAEVTGARLPS